MIVLHGIVLLVCKDFTPFLMGRKMRLLLFAPEPNSRIFGMVYAKSTSFMMPFCCFCKMCAYSAVSTAVTGHEANSNICLIVMGGYII